MAALLDCLNLNPPAFRDPIAELLGTYTELNSSYVEELRQPPSALEFMRFVAKNRPFVVRGGAWQWDARKLWSKDFLLDALKDQMVNVAVTPLGNADSPISDDGTMLLVKPWEESQPFEVFVNYITAQHEDDSLGEVRYAQTQNDNLRGEYVSLFSDVEKDISWARIAFQTEPEAINLWIGNSRSITALHRDNYENVYCQIVGQKHFALLPPLAHACVGEQSLIPASYVREGGTFKITRDSEGDPVPFPTWDPDNPGERATPYSHLFKALRVTLDAGDILYLPALWYHKVSQTCSSEGFSCSVNYWYDMCYEGNFFPACSLARNVALALKKT